MLLHVLLGLALGVGSSVLPGPCNLAVITAASRHGLRRALGTGLGAALGDTTYAALGILGLGPLLARHPALPPVLQAVSGIALIGYGLAHLRARRAAPPATGGSDQDPGSGDGVRGLAVGLATLVANPGAIVTWVVIVGSVLAGASATQGWATVAGIGVGSFMWFALVGVVSCHGRAHRDDRVHRVTQVVSRILVAYGVVSLVRAAQVWFAS